MSEAGPPKGIAPRNLTARASYRAVGNPANSRIESGVGNCFPGLEMDVRDLDRRFFPGLVFNAVRVPLNPLPEAPLVTQGFHLVYVDYMYDPMLPDDSAEPWVQTLLAAYRGDIGAALSTGRWFLDWVEQGGKRIEMADGHGKPHDGMLVWRFVRSLEAGPDKPVRIGLVRRDETGACQKPPITLEGYRRQYRTAAGVFDESYQSGELTQSLCSPWTHDFRDCGCHYWPANHPDVVMGEGAAGTALPGGQSSDPLLASTYLDWLRADRGPAGAAAARNTVEQNRPFQVDHYEINHVWQNLPLVVEGRETGNVYQRAYEPPAAAPYGGKDGGAAKMIKELRGRLAPLEMVLMLQYLYAYFSLADPQDLDEETRDRWPALHDNLTFARRTIMAVAIGEMAHLRWANQLLWELDRESYQPVVEPAEAIRYGTGGKQVSPRKLERLTPEVLDRFIEIERPGGAIDTAYAQCVATLKERDYFEPHLYEIAVEIDSEGIDHFLRFKQIKEVLAKYHVGTGDPAYLRPIGIGTGENEHVRTALGKFADIKEGLGKAYTAEAQGRLGEAQDHIARVRDAMSAFRTAAETAAAANLGVPFWQDRPSAGAAS